MKIFKAKLFLKSEITGSINANSITSSNLKLTQLNTNPSNTTFLSLDSFGNVEKTTGVGTGGVSGTSGTSGLSFGTSGTSGTNGNSGSSGTSGTSGTSGVNGTAGSSGSGGTSASSGSSGTSGSSASSGSSGSSGESGTAGTSGLSYGTSGTAGTSGLSYGTSGTSGVSGTLLITGSTYPITGSYALKLVPTFYPSSSLRSGVTGTETLAGFNTVGLPVLVKPTTNNTYLVYQNGTIKWIPIAAAAFSFIQILNNDLNEIEQFRPNNVVNVVNNIAYAHSAITNEIEQFVPNQIISINNNLTLTNNDIIEVQQSGLPNTIVVNQSIQIVNP